MTESKSYPGVIHENIMGLQTGPSSAVFQDIRKNGNDDEDTGPVSVFPSALEKTHKHPFDDDDEESGPKTMTCPDDEIPFAELYNERAPLLRRTQSFHGVPSNRNAAGEPTPSERHQVVRKEVTDGFYQRYNSNIPPLRVCSPMVAAENARHRAMHMLGFVRASHPANVKEGKKWAAKFFADAETSQVLDYVYQVGKNLQSLIDAAEREPDNKTKAIILMQMPLTFKDDVGDRFCNSMVIAANHLYTDTIKEIEDVRVMINKMCNGKAATA
jgi:hypothetical protein